MLRDFGDDTRPSCTGVGDINSSVGEFNDRRGDRGEGAFEGLDEVGFGGDIAKCVCGVGDAEVWESKSAMSLN